VAAALVVGGVTALVLVVAGAAHRPGSPP
jgi:hypothetical protein